MAERDGIVVLKWGLFGLNLFLWLFGIGVLVFAMWLFFDTGNADAPEKLDQHLRFLSVDLNYFYAAVYLLMGAGLISLCTGVFGWLGAYRESYCMLTSYTIIMSIVLVCHFTAAGVSYGYRHTISNGLTSGIQNVVQNQYGEVPEYYRETEIIDYIQSRFNCCGGVEYEDWSSSKWKDQPKNLIDEVVPASCCFGSSGLDNICPTYNAILGGKNPYLHQTGCITILHKRFNDYIVGIAAGGGTVGIFELLAVILTVVMLRKLHNEDKKIY